MSAHDVAAGLRAVEARIASACARAQRARSEVTLVAVSKTHPDEAVRAAYDAGQRVFAENYAAALVSRAALVRTLPGASLRFVGHLQRNKVRAVLETGAAIETVDSERLALAIDEGARARGVAWPVLLQVNVGREAQKSGCLPEDLPALVRAVRALAGLRLEGLMTVPPHTEDPEGARPHFAALRTLAAAHGLGALSMGMSHDLEVAIAEGATHVRVGTAIFGDRR